MSSRAVVVAEAADALQAHLWVDALRRAGIEATTFERGAGAALGGAALPYLSVFPVVVSGDSLGAARSIIADIAGATVLSRYSDPDESRTRRTVATTAIALLALAGLAVLLATRSLP